MKREAPKTDSPKCLGLGVRLPFAVSTQLFFAAPDYVLARFSVSARK